MVERAESDEADDEKLVSIVRTADTTHARALVALLESKGIWSHAQGLEDATLGALGIVRVRAKDARSARKLLRSLERGKPLRPLGDEDVDAPTYRGSARVRAEPEAEPTELVRLKRVATMVSIVIPGGGHLYVRRYPPVLALWFLYFVVIYAALHGVRGAASLGFVVMFADALGASWRCDLSQGRPVEGSPRRFAVPVAGVLTLLGLYALR